MKSARDLAEQHYRMTCCPNADYKTFKTEWWQENDNGLVVEELVRVIQKAQTSALEEAAIEERGLEKNAIDERLSPDYKNGYIKALLDYEAAIRSLIPKENR